MPRATLRPDVLPQSPLRHRQCATAIRAIAISGLAMALTAPLPGWLTKPALAQTASNTTANAHKPFAHAGVARDAERFEAWLKANVKPGSRSYRQLMAAGASALAGGKDPRAAYNAYAAAAAAAPDEAAAWSGAAQALLAIPTNSLNGNERYRFPEYAGATAYLAYQRATSAAQKAEALSVLSAALSRRSLWRPAIDALAVSLTLVDSAEVRQAYQALREKHGFRVTNYKVDNEAATPRVCIEFSERLAGGAVDFAKFIAVDGRDPEAATAEGTQLCVDGLAHGKRYDIQVRSGLPSLVGEALHKAAELSVYVRDRSPMVRVTGKSYVLPSRGQQGIPIVTVNTDKVAVEIYRIGDRGLLAQLSGGDGLSQLSSWQAETLKEKSGTRIYAGTLAVTSKLNEEVTTAVPVSEAITRLQPGVYAMIAKPIAKASGETGDQIATQWFIISDLGLTAFSAENGLHGYVRSLASAEAIPGASVRLVARNNEVLATAKTDANGYVRFDTGLKKGEGGNAPALLVAESAGGDYAFLDLTANAFDLTDRGVKGREAPGAIDGFLYTDRGVYRAGEDVHLTSLVRDAASRATAVPTTLVILRPDGVEHRRFVGKPADLGGNATRLTLAATAMTGTWRARLFTDPKAPAIAQTAFLVEDFVPEKLALDLTAESPALSPGETGSVAVAGRYLYGPPAAGLALEGEVVVKTSKRDLPGFAGYHFGQSDEVVTPVRTTLESLGRTDAKGLATVAVTLPQLPRTARTLDADIAIKLAEPGGRVIERRVALPVVLPLTRIGVKPLFKGDALGEGETARFDIAVAGADGKPAAAAGLTWDLLRLEQAWQWAKRDGQWTYDAVTITRKVASGTVATTAAGAATVSAPVNWGRYRIEVTSRDADIMPVSHAFTAGWYAAESADSPEVLEVALDKPSYRAGDTAKLKIATRRGGRALISVFSTGLKWSHEVTIPNGGGEVAVPVAADWGAGAYVAATLYRPMDETARRMPGRALGLSWLALDQAPRTLSIKLDAPETVRPGTRLMVPVTLTGIAAGEAARVTVAAVDVGILSLTRFETPAPGKWFHQQRRLGAEIRDLYGRLIDGMRAERGALRSGGDGDGSMSLDGAPSVEATVALFSGIVEVGADGTASVAFDMPEFNGSIRLMAVAWSADKVGHASRDVIVRDKLALTVGAPRFLTLGDTATLDLSVHNVEGPAGAYTISLNGETETGSLTRTLSQDVALKTGERGSRTFQLKPNDVGRLTYRIRLAGPGGIQVARTLDFDVKAPGGDIRRTTVSTLAPGARVTVSGDLVADMIAARTRVSLSVGPNARLDVPGLIGQLDRYPYGCAEQTVSRALPLLYVNQLAATNGLPADIELKARVQKAVDRVLEMQDSSGAFGIWGPSSTDLWLTGYVTDFLTRARETGVAVSPERFTQALDRLANFIGYAEDFERGGEDRAYALYVLARNGRAPIGELRYYADTRLERFSTPLAKAQIGAALAMLGDRERAERAFRAALDQMGGADAGLLRQDYGSDLRDRAGLVTLASETRTLTGEVPRLAGVIADAFQSRRHTSTQEQAWLLLAAKSMADEARDLRLSVGGTSHSGALNRTLTAASVAAGQLVVTNRGSEPTSAVISVIGAALTPEPASSNGFTIERSYFTLDGKPVDLASASGGAASVKQTDRLVAVVKVTAAEPGGRVLLVDRLPAGLEIENPRLVDSGSVKALAWLKTELAPVHTEFRDDRFVAAFHLFPRANQNQGGSATAAPVPTTFSVAYVVRAVTPGSFVHPAATVEDMYRPERFARTATGRLSVTARE